MSVNAPDFKHGKAKGLTWNLLNSFLSFIKQRRTEESDGYFPVPSVSIADEALRRFTRQPSLAILRLACQVFQLSLSPSKCDLQVSQLACEGSYKAACDAAVCLKRFHFPIEVFCLPLLLMGNTSSMENYLDNCPEGQTEFLQCLDRLSSGELTVSDLTFSYPAAKPQGANKLSSKPLDKMMRKYAERWRVPDTQFPRSKDRWAKVDLNFWVRQMFSDRQSFDLQLENWREIVISKVGEDKSLQEYLVSQVFCYSAAEGGYLASVFNCDSHDLTTSIPTLTETDKELNKPRSADVEYFELPFSEEKIILVDSREKFLEFLSSFESLSPPGLHVGLDVEFFQQKLSLIQISLEEEIFLLDWELLPAQLTQGDVLSLKEKVLLNTNLLIVGFGVTADMKLLSKSLPGCEDLLVVGRNVLDLERVRARLGQLVGLGSSSVRGLSGLCHSVLGRPLDKAQQISDWSRRPLRPAQLTYAALDAFSCWKIFQVLKLRATDLSLEGKFADIVSNETKKLDIGKKKEKVKMSPEEARAKLEASVPDLVQPLFSSAQQPGDVRLVCDDMLQGLCRKLRMFGVDCLALSNGQDHLDCVLLATQDNRFVVSRGTAAARINKRLPPGHTLAITTNELDLQVEEVFRYFFITPDHTNLFSRCVLCNGSQYYELSQDLLRRLADNLNSGEDKEEEVEGCKWESVVVTNSQTGEDRQGEVNMMTGYTDSGVAVQVKSMARATIGNYQQFWACGDCGKVYFEGSHWVKASDSAKAFLTNK